MELTWKGIMIAVGILGMLGPLVAIMIRQFNRGGTRVLLVGGKTIHCLSDTRGIRVACDERVIFSAAKFGLLLKTTVTEDGDHKIKVSYFGLLPRLVITINGEKLTRWPFHRAEWWARFFGESWPLLSLVALSGLLVFRFWIF